MTIIHQTPTPRSAQSLEELGEAEKNEILKTVCEKFEKYTEARITQLQDISAIREAIYSTGSKNRYHKDFTLPDIWELAQTLKAHLIENLCSTPESMFDVTGATFEAQKYANRQKSMLVNYFEKMNIQDELEKIINSIVETGEATLFVGWKTKTRKIRRINKHLKDNPAQNLSDKTLDTNLQNENAVPEENAEKTYGDVIKDSFITEEKIIFDGPVVRFIEAQDFVFDPERANAFETASKIYRSYATITEICSDPLNSLLDERKITELMNMTRKTSNVRYTTSEAPQNEFLSNSGVKGEQIELLEFWGDIAVGNKVFTNVLVVVAGRKEIIRLEQNPFVTQPFVHASVITDPSTLRGVSPLKIALGISEISSCILNKQLDALSLIINPPYLAPKGCFKGEQFVTPGKIIEYDAALMPNQPIPLNFSAALQGWDFINFFKTSIESATGIYKTMAGNLSSLPRTATEINFSASGQSARLNMLIDTISRRIIVPMVEKTALTLANFKLGEEEIPIKNNGNIEFITVSDDVRCNDYVYCYGDKRATLERKYRFKELFDIVAQFAQRSDFAQNIDLVECFKFALEQYGIENPSKFLSNQPPQNLIQSA